MSVADYFADKYSALSYPQLPCVQVHPKSKNTYIPMECFEVYTAQKVVKKLTDQQTASMIRVSKALPPNLATFQEEVSLLTMLFA